VSSTKNAMLKTRVIIYSYNHHVRLLPPERLVVKRSILGLREPTPLCQVEAVILRGELRCFRRFRSWITTPYGQRYFGAKPTESGPCLGAESCKSSIPGQRRCQALQPNPSSISFSLSPTRQMRQRTCRSWNVLATRCSYGNPIGTSTACLRGLLRTSTCTFLPLAVRKSTAF